MLPFGHPAGSMALDPLLLLLLALAVDAVLGDMPAVFRYLPHPVKTIGHLIAAGDRKLNRPGRSPRDRVLRGLLLVVFMVGVAVAVGLAVVFASLAVPRGWLLELFLVAVLLAQRGLFDHVRAVADALRDEGVAAARKAVAHIVGRDPDSLDQHGVARAAIESCAENFSDGVVAPVFWYVLFGFPGLLVYKTVNTMDSMIGHRSDHYRAFGWAAARLDDALNLLPARLAGLMLALAALFVPNAHPWRALATMWRDAGHHRSPNSGWPEGAMAGALGLALAGPRRYGAETVREKWIGDGRARATHQDIRRALYVYGVACLLNAGAVVGLLILRQGWAG